MRCLCPSTRYYYLANILHQNSFNKLFSGGSRQLQLKYYGEYFKYFIFTSCLQDSTDFPHNEPSRFQVLLRSYRCSAIHTRCNVPTPDRMVNHPVRDPTVQPARSKHHLQIKSIIYIFSQTYYILKTVFTR